MMKLVAGLIVCFTFQKNKYFSLQLRAHLTFNFLKTNFVLKIKKLIRKLKIFFKKKNFKEKFKRILR